MRAGVALVILGLWAAPAARAQEFDPQARMTEAFQQVRPVAYHRDRLDWARIEARARSLAAGARDEVDLMAAYQAVVSYLEDNHSFVRYPDGLMARWRERYGARRMLPDPPAGGPAPTSTFMDRVDPEVRTATLTSGEVAATIIVPAVAESGTVPSLFGSRLHAAVRDAPSDVCGYVLDLRGNTGGDMFPMIVGLLDLIGDGHTMHFVNPDGSRSSMRISDGAVYGILDDGERLLLDKVESWRPAPHALARPVAVLLDDATASSGEGTALALIGREGVRTFGGRTAGRASANQMIQLSDGTRLFVTVAMMADRLDRTYPGGIEPDVPIAAEAGRDVIEEAGRAWLAQQPACGG